MSLTNIIGGILIVVSFIAMSTNKKRIAIISNLFLLVWFIYVTINYVLV